MALTIATGQQAGQYAGQGAALQAAIAAIEQALAAGVQIEQVVATTNLGQLADSIPLSTTDSATVLNTLLTIYQNMLTWVETQLQGM